MPFDLWAELELQKDKVAAVIDRAALLEHFFQQSKIAIAITSGVLDKPGPKIEYVNPAWEALTGYSVAEVIGETPRILQGDLTSRRVLDRLKSTLRSNDAFSGIAWNYRKDGAPFVICWHAISAIRDRTGRITHYISFQREGAEYTRLLEQYPDFDLWEFLNGARGFPVVGRLSRSQGMVSGMVEVPDVGALRAASSSSGTGRHEEGDPGS